MIKGSPEEPVLEPPSPKCEAYARVSEPPSEWNSSLPAGGRATLRVYMWLVREAALTRYVQKIYHDFEVEDSAARILAGLRQRSLPRWYLATTTPCSARERVAYSRVTLQRGEPSDRPVISARGTSSSCLVLAHVVVTSTSAPHFAAGHDHPPRAFALVRHPNRAAPTRIVFAVEGATRQQAIHVVDVVVLVVWRLFVFDDRVESRVHRVHRASRRFPTD